MTTKAQLEEVKNSLSNLYSQDQFLRVDGYLIAPRVVQFGMALKIVVYVNGWQKGKWTWHGRESEMHTITEIAKRFYRLSARNLYSAKEMKSWERFYGSKAKAKKNGVYEKFYSASFVFNTAGSFIAHIKKHNQSIEILTCEEYQAALNALPDDWDEGDVC